MVQRAEISEFVSIVLYPNGNEHFRVAIPQYRQLLKAEHQAKVFGCTFEKFINAIDGNEEILKWKAYLSDRYLVR